MYLCPWSVPYRKGLHWILNGDTNDLKLNPTLDLNIKLKQCVKSPTRLSPFRIIDPIITTLVDYYQLPQCLPPLDPDPDLDGKPSDHLMVVMSPVSTINNRPARERRHVTYRPYSDTRLQEMGEWFEGEEWIKLLDEQDANMKMSRISQEQKISKMVQNGSRV